MTKNNKKPSEYDVALSLITQGTQIIKTNQSNDLIYLYNNGYWEYNDSIPLLKIKIQRIMNEKTTKNFVDETIECIRRLTYQPAEQLEKDRRYLHLNNFIYDIKKGKTLEFSPNYFVTTRISATYEPKQSTAKINNYCKTLVQYNDVMKLQEHLGDILSPHTATKKLLYLYGKRNSGKSTLLNIIASIIGRRNYCSLTMGQLNEKFTNFGIYERIANICSEMPHKITLKNLEHIKALTGGDYITIEKKYMQPFEYRPIIKHIFAANGIPHISLQQADEAFFSRFDFIEFPYSFKPDSTIISKYTTEEIKSAWFNWLLEGYHRLRDNGWEFTNQLDVDAVEQLFTKTKNNPHLFYIWLREHYSLSTAANDYLEKKELHKDYLEYCKEHNVASRYQYPYTSFCKRMLNQDIIPVVSAKRGAKGNQKSVFLGIKKLE